MLTSSPIQRLFYPWLLPSLFCSLLCCAYLPAQSITVNSAALELSTAPLSSQDVLPYLQVATQKGAISSLLELVQKTKWKKYAPDDYRNNQSGLVLKLLVNNPSSEPTDHVFYLHDLQRVRLYYRAVGTTDFAEIDAGILQCPGERQLPRGLLIPGYGFSTQVKLSLPAGLSEVYFDIKYLVQKPFTPKLEIYPTSDWNFKVAASFEDSIAIHLLFIGAMWIMAIYHLLIFFQRRDQTFLWYALYTLVLSSMVMIESGIMQIYVTADFPTVNALFPMIIPHAFASYIVYWLFLRSFINLKQLHPRLDRFLLRFLSVFVAITLLIITVYLSRLWTDYLDLLTIGYFIPLSGITVGIVYFFLLLRLKNKLVNIFLLGSFILLLGVLINTLISGAIYAGWLEELPFPRFIISEIGAIIELIIFAFALGYRFQLVDNERHRMKELNALKSRFFTNISHEFRTPLTVISGLAEQIDGHPKMTQSIRRNSQELLSLVNQLLDLSAADAGQLQPKPIHSNIIPYLNYLTESHSFSANQKNIHLVFFSATENISMDFDEENIKRVVTNLISNALKFTPSGGKVLLQAQKIKRANQPWLQLNIKDNGVGISHLKLPLIFDRFYQTNDPTSHPQSGSGVGLALVKELVELSGGQISVTSQPKQGTEFTVLLPITNTAEATVLNLTNATTLPLVQRSPSLDASTTDDQGTKELILIIEDNQDIVSYLTQLLSPNYQVISANDGRAGIDLALKNIPDIIISDVMMPEVNGYEVCQTLKNTTSTSHIPIIILSAKASMQDRLEGLARGADAYLVKPFNKEELFTRLEQLVQLRQTLKGRYENLALLTTPTAPSAYQTDPTIEEPKYTTTTTFDLNDTFLHSIISLIEKRLDDTELGVSDLENAARLSSMQVNRKLKALTGKTGNSLIRYIRLHKAAQLLHEPDLNIAEVAYRVGFNDPNYFSRAFSSEFGVPPSEFNK